jgi:hypothetical protein
MGTLKMVRKSLLTSLAGAALAMGLASTASAANFAYMTGTSPPWGQATNEAAMDIAFGAANWNGFYGFDASVFTSGYAFVYLDGSDNTTNEINAFLSTNLSGLESFVNAGGNVFVNIARNQAYGTTLTGFGTSTTNTDYSESSSSADLTAAGLSAGLDLNGAGAAFTGGYFSHDRVDGVDTCYVTGTAGCVFGSKGRGLFVGGQTTTNFHGGGNPLQLRANELTLAANGAVAPVPEPATWAMMIIGFGAAGSMIRRRKAVFA